MQQAWISWRGLCLHRYGIELYSVWSETHNHKETTVRGRGGERRVGIGGGAGGGAGGGRREEEQQEEEEDEENVA